MDEDIVKRLPGQADRYTEVSFTKSLQHTVIKVKEMPKITITLDFLWWK